MPESRNSGIGRQKMKERIQEEVGCRLQEGVPPCNADVFVNG
jgi:hypothetical protein